MPTLFAEPDRRRILDRLNRLAATHPPQWGRMNAPQMLVHVADQLRLALRELEAASMRSPLRYSPLKQLIIYVLPWPKGAKTAPELLDPVPQDWSADRAALETLIDRFASTGVGGPGGSWPTHPVFADLSGRAWGVLTYRHLDHHLRQFSV